MGRRGEVCRRVLEGRAGQVRAVGVSALGPCVLPADEDERPLRPAILYGIDSRASEQVERLTAELGADPILARCGSRLSSQSAGPKIRWLADEEPEVWSATRRIYGASSFLVSRLTGEYVLDHHSASQWAPLYDVHRNAWIDEWTDRVAPGAAAAAAGLAAGAVRDGEPRGGRRDRAARGHPGGRRQHRLVVRGGRLRAAGSRRGPARLRHEHVPHRGPQPGSRGRAAVDDRGLHAGVDEPRRRRRLRRRAHGVAARPGRRRGLRRAVRRGRRGRARGRRPARAALLRRRAHAAVRPRPARRRSSA